MPATTPNYRDAVFQHYQDRTKITGTPSYTGLALLERQCKANKQLLSSLLALNRSSPEVPFVRPVLPILPDLSQSTQAQINEAHRLFAVQTNTFNSCNQVERAIIRQFNTALDKDCLAGLINEDTGLIQGTVPEMTDSKPNKTLTLQSLLTPLPKY